MNFLSTDLLADYRQKTFLTAASLRLRSQQEAVRFVNERGFILFWPSKGITMPSLWNAVAGDRPVPDDHDDPAHISWSWKDELLDKRVWYYGRVLHKRNTIISLETIPYFYALSPNYGDPEAEINDQYYQGLIPMEAKSIFETLLDKGPLDSITLRHEAHLTGSNSNAPFTRALDMLQRDLRVLPIAVSDAGAWHYAFVYDLTHRYHPELPEQSRFISENQARTHLLECFLRSVGAATQKQVRSLFGWTEEQSEKAIKKLQENEVIGQPVQLENSNNTVIGLKELTG